MRKARIFIILALFFSFVFAFGGCSVQEKPTNIFEYVVKIEEGIISPREVEFLASPEEVLEANKDSEVHEVINPEGYAFKGKVFEGISGDVIECYNFEDDKLASVTYIVNFDETVDKAGFEEVCNTLYDMAVEYMPMPSGVTFVESTPDYDGEPNFEYLKEGNCLSWNDIEGNGAGIAFFYPNKYQDFYVLNITVSVSRHILYEAVYG